MRKSKKHNDPKILYMAGPGDVVSTFDHWRCGQDDPSQVAMTYSGQFFELCRRLDLSAIVVSYHSREARDSDGSLEVLHKRVPFRERGGLLFHLGWYWFHLSLCWLAIRERCDVLIIMSGTHLWPYWPAKWLGKRIVLTQHCVIWPKSLGARGFWKMVHRLDRGFFRAAPDSIISMSSDITNQIKELTGGRHAPIVTFLPSYRREDFAGIPDASHGVRPFRVLFAGRTEANKGVFEVIEIGRRLKEMGRTDIVIDIAGDGEALPEMKRQVQRDGLQDIVLLHGYCERTAMKRLLADCHSIIVPTGSDMIEGFNKVIAEAVLAHRPWISCHLCPAIEYVREAGVEVPPEDVQAYLNAILLLSDDDALYQEKVVAATRLEQQFYDPEKSWSASVKKCLKPKYLEINPSDAVNPAEHIDAVPGRSSS